MNPIESQSNPIPTWDIHQETSAELEQWMRALRSATKVVVPPAQPHSRQGEDGV